MLKYDYKNRISARESLDHEWFKNAPSKAIDKDLMKNTLQNLKTF